MDAPSCSNRNLALTEASAVPGGMLAREYPIELTDRFQAAFCQDPQAVPPADVRVALWKALDGQRLHAEQLAQLADEAQARYQRELEHYQRAWDEYQNRCDAVAAENERIERRNRERVAQHQRLEAAHQEALAAHQRRYCPRRVERLQGNLRRRLERIIRQQNTSLASVHRRGVAAARRCAVRSRVLYCWLLTLVGYAAVAAIYPLAAFVPALLSLHWWRTLMAQSRQDLAQSRSEAFADPGFYTYNESPHRRLPAAVYTPVHFHLLDNRLPYYACYREACPFDGGPAPRRSLFMLAVAALACVPFASAVVLVLCGFALVVRLMPFSGRLQIARAARLRRKKLLAQFDEELTRPAVADFLQRKHKRPRPPAAVSCEPLLPLPQAPRLTPPTLQVPTLDEFEPPAYDDGTQGNYSHTLRGSLVYTGQEVATLARQRLFHDGHVRPYVAFGGVPLPLEEKQSPHFVCIGTAGSGKTTIMQMLMSALLPLTQSQAHRIIKRSPRRQERLPVSSHEWSRSFTHQAVVYNAKDENIPFLAALGFNPDKDLIILDPADERCFAWDVSRDITDRRSISQFANLLVPSAKEHDAAKRDGDFWDLLAKRMIKAIIVSLRNAQLAAGVERPFWTFRDLVNAVETRETLYEVLGSHDAPERMRSQLVDLHGPQADSIYLSATNYIAQFDEAGERWEEARRLGRTFSFKEWAKSQHGSVLVLPNTLADPEVNEPLNRVFFKTLTNTVLTHENSSARDESGREHVRPRYFFVDEVGQAGHIADLERLMSEGRSFGVQVMLGVHQLSQLRKTYGQHGAETILGLCSHLAFLKTGDPSTSEWMSKRVGDVLRAYDKKSFAVSVTDGRTTTETHGSGTTDTRGTNKSRSKGRSEGDTHTTGSTDTHPVKPNAPDSNGAHTKSANKSLAKNRSTSEQDTEGTSKQRSNTTNSSNSLAATHTDGNTTTNSQDLRQETAVFYGEFQNLPDPTYAGKIAGYFITPAFPIWRADMPFAMLAPRLESPEALETTDKTVPWQDEERVSRLKPWTDEDYSRLCMRRPSKQPKRLEDNRDGELPAEFDF